MIGKTIAYKSIGIYGESVRFAKVIDRSFHEGLNTMVYKYVSNKGNTLRLTIDEIEFVVN